MSARWDGPPPREPAVLEDPGPRCTLVLVVLLLLLAGVLAHVL